MPIGGRIHQRFAVAALVAVGVVGSATTADARAPRSREVASADSTESRAARAIHRAQAVCTRDARRRARHLDALAVEIGANRRLHDPHRDALAVLVDEARRDLDAQVARIATATTMAALRQPCLVVQDRRPIRFLERQFRFVARLDRIETRHSVLGARLDDLGAALTLAGIADADAIVAELRIRLEMVDVAGIADVVLGMTVDDLADGAGGADYLVEVRGRIEIARDALSDVADGIDAQLAMLEALAGDNGGGAEIT